MLIGSKWPPDRKGLENAARIFFFFFFCGRSLYLLEKGKVDCYYNCVANLMTADSCTLFSKFQPFDFCSQTMIEIISKI